MTGAAAALAQRSRLSPRVLFAVRFLTVFVALTVLVEAEWFERAIRWPLCESLAAVTSAALRSIGIENVRAGHVLSLGAMSLSVVSDCDGILPYSLYIAAVVATPAGERRRPIVAAVPGLFVLAALNWLRIFSLAVVAARWDRWFDVLHTDVWEWLLVAALVALWLAWARWSDARLSLSRSARAGSAAR